MMIVPKYILSLQGDVQTKMGLYFHASYYAASKIFLDDANTAAAPAYHLLGARLGWKIASGRGCSWNLYAGADNLLDETYSLGNDINAAAGRYYNAAPRRNYYAGIAFQWIAKKTPAR